MYVCEGEEEIIVLGVGPKRVLGECSWHLREHNGALSHVGERVSGGVIRETPCPGARVDRVTFELEGKLATSGRRSLLLP